MNEDIKKCRLCLVKDATKTGSHIVPQFLIQRYENIESKKGRGYDISFDIGGLTSKAHLGQSVLENQYKPIFGEFTQEDIEKNTHSLIEDEYFCPRCENRFSMVEKVYADTISHFDKKGQPKEIPNEIGILLWCSVFWRLAEQRSEAMHFTDEEMEQMRSVLDECLPEEKEKPNIEKIRLHMGIQKLSYAHVRCETNKDISKFLWVHPEYTKPHAIIIADQITLFSLDGDYSDRYTGNFLGIENYVQQAPINKVGQNESFIIIPSEKFEKIIKPINEYAAKIRIENLFDFFDIVYGNLTQSKKPMPCFMKMEIISNLALGETKLGRRYTQEEIMNNIKKILVKYGKPE